MGQDGLSPHPSIHPSRQPLGVYADVSLTLGAALKALFPLRDGLPATNLPSLPKLYQGCAEPGLIGAAGHVGWYAPHPMLRSPPTPGLTDSWCRAREVLQLKKSRTQQGADRQVEEETDVESMWCADCI